MTVVRFERAISEHTVRAGYETTTARPPRYQPTLHWTDTGRLKWRGVGTYVEPRVALETAIRHREHIATLQQRRVERRKARIK